MTSDHCAAQLKRLTVLRGIPEDVVEYFAALDDVPDEVFTGAIAHALKTRQWFPTPAELRADCDAVAPPLRLLPAPVEEVLVGGGRDVIFPNPFGGAPLRLHVTRSWHYDCETCADSGWAGQRCPDAPCGRTCTHEPHEWVERCACVSWNPTIRRRREATAKYAQPPEKVGT